MRKFRVRVLFCVMSVFHLFALALALGLGLALGLRLVIAPFVAFLWARKV